MDNTRYFGTQTQYANRITGIIQGQSNKVTVDIFLNVNVEKMDAMG
jgi:hypothetical protein